MRPEILFVLGAVVVIALAIVGYIGRQWRRQELAQLAAAMGLAFSEEKDQSLQDRYSEFACLKQGDDDRYAFNRLSGTWEGRSTLAFDYHYETHSTDAKGHRQSSSHYFSAVIVKSPVPLKSLLVRPEGLLDKMKAFFGAEDINFESAEFSRRFYVKSPDRRWAYDVLHAQAIEFLLAMPDFRIQFGSAHVIIWRDDTFSPETFRSAWRVACGLLDRLPNYLIEQQNQFPAQEKTRESY